MRGPGLLRTGALDHASQCGTRLCPWTTASEPSCAVQGTQRRTCQDCGSVQTQSTSVLGHAFSDGYYMGANDGTYFKRCTRPGCDARTDVKYNPYTVVFDANGGTGNMNSQPFVYQTPVALFVNQYTRDYHTFQGWNSQSDGGGTAYEDGQSVLNLNKNLWRYGYSVCPVASEHIYHNICGWNGWATECTEGASIYGETRDTSGIYPQGIYLPGFYTEPDGGLGLRKKLTYHMRIRPITLIGPPMSTALCSIPRMPIAI